MKKELTILKILTVAVVITSLPLAIKQARRPARRVVPLAAAPASETGIPGREQWQKNDWCALGLKNVAFLLLIKP